MWKCLQTFSWGSFNNGYIWFCSKSLYNQDGCVVLDWSVSTLFVEANPIPIKAIMYLAGLLDTLEYRLPLTAPSAETMKKLEEVLKNYEVIK